VYWILILFSLVRQLLELVYTGSGDPQGNGIGSMDEWCRKSAGGANSRGSARSFQYSAP
jgi:hypothetical protein